MQVIVHVGTTFKDFEKKIKHNYQDVKYDYDGWVDASKYLPIDFDLCTLKTETKTIPGWHTNYSWDGRRLKEGEKVLYWKRKTGTDILTESRE